MSEFTVNLTQVRVGDYIKQFEATVDRLEVTHTDRTRRNKRNLTIHLSDGRLVLAQQNVILTVCTTGKLRIPWNRQVVPHYVDVVRD